jgi:hypothetical protein
VALDYERGVEVKMHPPSLAHHWEDGTINFQTTAAVGFGVEYMENIGVLRSRSRCMAFLIYFVCMASVEIYLNVCMHLF